MDKYIRQVEFSKLRFAYFTIKSFLESESGMDVKSLNSKLALDLGITGDDSYELIVKFIKKFELDNKGFEYEKHFYSEDELYNPGVAFINLITLTIWLPLKVIELLTFNKIRVNKLNFYQSERHVTDMTFRDLLTWYIEGRYVTSDEIKFETKNSTQQPV